MWSGVWPVHGWAAVSASRAALLPSSSAWRTGSAAGGELLQTLRAGEIVTSLAATADGASIFCGTSSERALVLDAASGEVVRRFAGHGPIALTADDARLASAPWTMEVRVWDAATGAQLHAFKGHQNTVTSLAFGRAGARLVSGSEDETVRIWALAF